jgi:asparagine synthase (glutamine-hydrolysing)
MCGILGHYRFEAGAPLPPSFDRLIDTLAHRGPDDRTYWEDDRFAFGHRRLSIIDLAGGRQPMSTEDGELVVTYNGEIYNYLELRQELTARGCRFATDSDTEVLLHGYREWGAGVVSRLIGMFAFGLADRRRRELFLARDRFGEKPLLYVDGAAGVTFASELTPLGIVVGDRRELDRESFGRYLCLNYVPGDATLLRQVKRVPPGSWRRYASGGRVETQTYFTPPDPSDVRELDMTDAVRELEMLLDESVRLTLRSDVPVGLFLSAGIDSSLVARSAARAGRLSRAFCLGFDEESYSEVAGAAATARHLDVPLTTVTLTPQVFDDFFEIVRHADEPMADSSAMAVWTLSREAARHVKVVLSGDGGDELFGGYLTHRASMWHQAVTARMPLALRRPLAGVASAIPTSEAKVSSSYKLARYLRAAALPVSRAHFSWNGAWMPAEAAQLSASREVRASALGSFDWMAERHGLADRVSLGDLQRADIGDYLSNDILVKSDRMAMAHGLEVRAPFLNRTIAEFALRLPATLKAGLSGHGKRVLRALAGRSYGVDVANARKQGFSVPIHAWLRGPARALAEELLAPSSLGRVEVLDASAVQRVLRAHMDGRRSYGFELWGLMVFVAWHRQQLQSAAAWSSASPAPERVVIGEAGVSGSPLAPAGKPRVM